MEETNEEPLPGSLTGFLPYMLSASDIQDIRRLMAQGHSKREAIRGILSPRDFAFVEQDIDDFELPLSGPSDVPQNLS